MGRVFEPYVTTTPGGTGLGLAIVKKIVDEHHGRIRIDSRVPAGAQVGLLLPLAPERAASTLGETSEEN
jgi:nitrogen fixation/metabolism regulation signal transduction histidine kinase